MGERIKSFYKKVTSFGLASVLAFSSLSLAAPVFYSQEASAWGPLSDGLVVSADSTLLEAETGIATISSQAVAEALWQDYNDAGPVAKAFVWNPLLNNYLGALPSDANAWAIAANTTITASTTTGEISTDLISWGSDAVSPIATGNQIFSQFYFKSNTPGVHTIEIVATITRPVSESGIPAWLLAWLGVGPKVLTGSLEIEVEDTTPPYVEITSPVGDFFNTDVEVRGTVTDANPRHYWLYITKDWSPVVNDVVLESDSFTDRLLETLSEEGEYVVTLAARDSVGGGASTGNRSDDVVKEFTIDKTKPVINYVVSPTTPTNGDVEVSFTCSDDLSGVEIDTINPVITATANGTILSEGDCIDYAGNEADPVEVEITNIDKIAPLVTIDVLATVEPNQTVVITGTIDDPTAALVVDVNGEPCVLSATLVDNGDGTWTWSCEIISPAVDGQYIVTASATDAVGNSSEDATADLTVETVLVEEEGDDEEDSETVADSESAPVFNFGTPDVLSVQDDQTDEQSDENQEVAAAQDDQTNEDEDGTFSPLGLAWYWWLLILAGLAGLWWFIAGWRRRQEEK